MSTLVVRCCRGSPCIPNKLTAIPFQGETNTRDSSTMLPTILSVGCNCTSTLPPSSQPKHPSLSSQLMYIYSSPNPLGILNRAKTNWIEQQTKPEQPQQQVGTVRHHRMYLTWASRNHQFVPFDVPIPLHGYDNRAIVCCQLPCHTTIPCHVYPPWLNSFTI